jgi:hypothetical protein
MESKSGGCLIFLLILSFNLVVGGLSFQYCLSAVFGKDVPWYADMIAGLFLAEFTVPGAIFCYVVRLCGVPAPFVH